MPMLKIMTLMVNCIILVCVRMYAKVSKAYKMQITTFVTKQRVKKIGKIFEAVGKE